MSHLISAESDRFAANASSSAPYIRRLTRILPLALILAMVLPLFVQKTFATTLPQRKEYLSEAEADKIRDADTPSERMKLFISFADDRLKKFQYELNRTAPERNRTEI